jgi:hypothetical protein
MGPGEADALAALVKRFAGRDRTSTPSTLTGLDPVASIGKLRNLLASTNLTDLPPEGLATLEEGRKYFIGTTVPVLEAQWAESQTGLIVPSSTARPTPFDVIQVYVTANDLVGSPLTGAEVLAALQSRTLDQALRFVAYWLGHLEDPGVDVRLLERQFVDSYFGGEPHRVAVGLLKGGRRILVPQLLLALAKASIAVCPDEEQPAKAASDDLPFVLAMFGIADLLGSGRAEGWEDESKPRWGGLPPKLALEMTSNLYFNSSYDEGSQVARFMRMWIELASGGSKKEPRAFADLFEEATRIPLLDLVAATFSVWTRCVGGNFAVAPAYFDDTALQGSRGKEVLDFLSAERAGISQALDDESALGFDWTYSAFERYPIARLANGDYLVLSPRLLLNRVFSGLVYFDVDYFLLGKRKRRGALRQLRGDVTASFVVESLREIYPALGGQQRVFEEADLQGALGEGQVCDAVVDYGDAFLLFEVTYRRLTRESAGGRSVDDLNNDIKNLIEAKGEQLNSTIEALRANPSALGGGLPLPRRYYPIIVTDDQFPVSPSVVDEYSRRLETAGYLQGEDVASLEVLSLEELEMIEAASAEGFAFREILDRKAKAGLGLMPLKTFMLVELGLRLGRPARVDAQFMQFADLVISYLRPQE